VYKMEYVGPPDDPHAHERMFLYLLSIRDLNGLWDTVTSGRGGLDERGKRA